MAPFIVDLPNGIDFDFIYDITMSSILSSHVIKNILIEKM